MPKIQIEYKDEKLDKAIRIHQVRYNFITKAEAIVDALTKFFSKEDYDYFLKTNEEMPVNQEEPDYSEKINSKKKHNVRNFQKEGRIR